MSVLAELAWWAVVLVPPIAGLWLGMRLARRPSVAWPVGMTTWLGGWLILSNIALRVPGIGPEIAQRLAG